MTMQYGLQRLGLLNSAGYRRAEVPLDAAVSVIAPNNTGKTSLINALQFMLIVDQRRMDFGAHSLQHSRRFYFPHSSAYILLEVLLPHAGTVVLGCVGKGVSHDYEYFAYQGTLNLDDFCLPNGQQVQQHQLANHFARLGKILYHYAPPEFAAAIYGRTRKRQAAEPDITIFKLEHADDAEVFQRVLTRTLRLDRLRAGDVKDYLLAIFKRYLPDHRIDFKAEWDKAFAEVNAERAQYLAAKNQLSLIQEMQQRQEKRLTLRGKILAYRPQIQQQLTAWQQHVTAHTVVLQQAIADTERQMTDFDQRWEQQKLQELQLKQQQHALQQQQDQFEQLSRRLCLLNAEQLQADRQHAQQQLNQQTALIENASGRSLNAIAQEQASVVRELSQAQRELASLGDNLYLALQRNLPEQQHRQLCQVLNTQVLTLSPADFSLDRQQLQDQLNRTSHQTQSTECRVLVGIHLNPNALPTAYQQTSPDDLSIRILDLEQRQQQLAAHYQAAQDLQQAKQQLQQYQRNLQEIEQQLLDVANLQQLQATEPARQQQLELLGQQLSQVQSELAQHSQQRRALSQREREQHAELEQLRKDAQQISQLREKRVDTTPELQHLDQLPHHPWTADVATNLAGLANRLGEYQRDCQHLLQLNDTIVQQLRQLQAGGLTKFQFEAGSEREIERIITFANNLAEEGEVLERKARHTVVNVTLCLRELRDGVEQFKLKMREFNRLIGRRQLSDLAVFKIEPVDEDLLLEAVQHLINTADLTESGDNFELFSQTSVLDDEQLNRAKQLLIQEGQARGGLKIEHFFRLEFVVGKQGKAAEAFTDMDAAASAGTVLMAKLVTGLALLHLMQHKQQRLQAVCYLDEAASLDLKNQTSLVEAAHEFGYTLVFAAPTPVLSARYCVPIHQHPNGGNLISPKRWQILERHAVQHDFARG